MKCPHCQKEFNAGKVMGSAKTPAKTAAAKKRGEWMKRAFANQKKMEGGTFTPEQSAHIAKHGVGPTPEGVVILDPRGLDKFDTRVMPKPNTLSEKKASALAALASVTRGTFEFVRSELEKGSAVYDDLNDSPHAPFDFNDEEGTPHRVRAYGKQLKVCFLRDGAEEPIRNLGEGELEALWEKRIK